MRLSALLPQILVRPRWAARARTNPKRGTPALVGRRRDALRSLAFAPVAFVLLLAAGWSAAETFTPEITDTEYHHRLQVIRTAAASHPRNPLGVVIGSSRLVWGFRPETLPEPATGKTFWVNGSHVGNGPVLNRLTLHRLLRDGVWPDVAVIEVMPAFFVRENARFVVGHFAASEMKMARGYGKFPLHFDYYFLLHRFARMTDLARAFDPFAGVTTLTPRGGHPKCEEDVTEAERERRTNVVRNVYKNDLANMAVRPAADRAFRDMLGEAGRHGVRVVLIRTPEGPTFQSWYNPAGAAKFDAYLAGVAREFGTPILDARNWLDENDFFDSHHMLRRGGDKFTARFAREIAPIVGDAVPLAQPKR
ncbi:MAG: hypothetical protein C0467_20965 [Planctomycetaceae bacterium]|nr:hypothetical protein [Planctomycetaceae bacterium]